MVHIGCGADVIRQRRRALEQRKQNEANGIFYIPPDFKPAKNKKYPYYTPLRNANIFEDRQKLSWMRKKALYKQKMAASEPVNDLRPPTLASQQKKSGSLQPYTSTSSSRKPTSQVLFFTKNPSSHPDHNIKKEKRNHLVRSDALDLTGQSNEEDDTKLLEDRNLSKYQNRNRTFGLKQKATLADVHDHPQMPLLDDDPRLINDLNSFMELHPLKQVTASIEDLCILESLLVLVKP